MRDWRDIFEIATGGDEPARTDRRFDGHSVAGRRVNRTRRALVREFSDVDELRLAEATTLLVGLRKLEYAVALGDTNAIATTTKISNRLSRLRRELAESAAKMKESQPC